MEINSDRGGNQPVMDKSIRFLKGISRRIIAPSLFYTGFYDFLFSRFSNKGIILMYHWINNSLENGCHTTWEKNRVGYFEAQMKYIKEKMNPVSVSDLVKYISAGKTIPKKAIAVTFDDGYEDNYTNAYPILKRHGIPATIFVTAGYVGVENNFWWDRVEELIKNSSVHFLDLKILSDLAEGEKLRFSGIINLKETKMKKASVIRIVELIKTLNESGIQCAIKRLEENLRVKDVNIKKRKILTWSQVKEMANDGIEIGSHTVNHPNLGKISQEEVEREISESKELIEEKICKPVHGFAIPYGLEGFYNKDVIEIIKRSNYQYSCSAKVGCADINSDIYELKRISASNLTLPLFAWKIYKYIR